MQEEGRLSRVAAHKVPFNAGSHTDCKIEHPDPDSEPPVKVVFSAGSAGYVQADCSDHTRRGLGVKSYFPFEWKGKREALVKLEDGLYRMSARN